MKILFTGFKPFLDNVENPSEALVKSLIENGYKGQVFEVAYSVIDEYFSSVDQKTFDFIISFGLASRRKEISIEQYAFNRVSVKTEDSLGFLPSRPYIAEKGAYRETSVIDAWKLADKLKEAGIDSYVSEDAGSYLCNYIYYTSLRATGGRALFIHLPQEGADFNHLYYERAAKIITAYIINLLDNPKQVSLN